MEAEKKEALKLYKRLWLAKNKDRYLERWRVRSRNWVKNNKEKAKEVWKKSRIKNRKQRREGLKKYYEEHKKDPKFLELRRKRSLTYYQNNKHKSQARRAVATAVKNGTLVKPKICSHCNESKRLEGHHTDYSRQLEVIWLCKKCHMSSHYPEPQSLSDKHNKECEFLGN